MKDTTQEIAELARAQGITLDPCLLREYPIGTPFWCVHHSEICEPLTEPLANRIRYILTQKPEAERRVRLKALRPVMNRAEYKKALAEYKKARAEAWAEYDKALIPQWDAEYPDHPKWDKHGLVF